MEAGALALSGKEHFRLRVELTLAAGEEAAMFEEERA